MCIFCAEIKFLAEYKQSEPATVPRKSLRKEHPAKAPLKQLTTTFLNVSDDYPREGSCVLMLAVSQPFSPCTLRPSSAG
jgi:hypothetical protein